VEAETNMSGSRSRREFGARLLVAAGALLTLLVGGSARARADVASPGTVPVRNEVRFEWGPLEGRIARPVKAVAGDTWEALATREAASVAWAPTIRALNGGGEAPKQGVETWVPPRTLAFGAEEPLFAAFLDSAKFGRSNDVSRSGFQALDPGRATHDVFGEVTLALQPVRDLESAAAAAALPRRRASETMRARPAGVLAVELGRSIDSVSQGAPLRRVLTTWRCESLAGGAGPSFARVGEERFDGQGVPLGGSGETPILVTYLGVVTAALLVLGLVGFVLARRRAWARRSKSE
jgi:hypothetical protein